MFFKNLFNFRSSNRVKIVTHNGRFHADDVFAIAALRIYFENKNQNVDIVRSRDPEVWKTADFVLDTGYVYDPEKNLFDHHQTGGAGERSNGVKYSSFGLIWKHYGDQIAGGVEERDLLDEKLVQTIDLIDVAENEKSSYGFYLYSVDNLIKSFNPNTDEQIPGDDENITYFLEAVAIAKRILEREIAKAKIVIRDEKEAEEIYNKAEDKRVIVIDKNISWMRVFCNKSEPIYVVQTKYGGDYAIRAVPTAPSSYELRKAMPKSWRGKSGKEFEDITGIKGATFCHNSGFLAGAKTKDIAIAMAYKALESKD